MNRIDNYLASKLSTYRGKILDFAAKISGEEDHAKVRHHVQWRTADLHESAVACEMIARLQEHAKWMHEHSHSEEEIRLGLIETLDQWTDHWQPETTSAHYQNMMHHYDLTVAREISRTLSYMHL